MLPASPGRRTPVVRGVPAKHHHVAGTSRHHAPAENMTEPIPSAWSGVPAQASSVVTPSNPPFGLVRPPRHGAQPVAGGEAGMLNRRRLANTEESQPVPRQHQAPSRSAGRPLRRVRPANNAGSDELREGAGRAMKSFSRPEMRGQRECSCGSIGHAVVFSTRTALVLTVARTAPCHCSAPR